MTDPARQRRTDPGNPEICNIFSLHKAFNSPETVQHVDTQCRTAGWGCIDCKKVLHEAMVAELTPIRIRAEELKAHPATVTEALDHGAEKARALARKTMGLVKDHMGLSE